MRQSRRHCIDHTRQAQGPGLSAPRLARRAAMKDYLLTNTFSELGLSAQLVSALTAAGFDTPTPIQAKAIPPQLQRRDIMGIAQTGSGKTAAFGLPILAGIAELTGRADADDHPRADPRADPRTRGADRRSAAQARRAPSVSTVLVLGGMSRARQVTQDRPGVDVVIATPGRLKDLIDDRKLRLNETRWLVLDEADRMLDMGFIGAVKQIAAAIGPRRQTAMFSATMAPEIAELAKGLLNDPVRVEADPAGDHRRHASTSASSSSGSKAKRGVLNELLADPALEPRHHLLAHQAWRRPRGQEPRDRRTCRPRRSTATRARMPARRRSRALLPGRCASSSPPISRRAASTCRTSRTSSIIELPDDAENYVHRIGRTARNGASGFAITLVRRHRARQAARRRAADPPHAAGQRRPEPRQRDRRAAGWRRAACGSSAPGTAPQGDRPKQRTQANAGRHFSGAKKAAIMDGRKPNNAVPRRVRRGRAAPVRRGCWWQCPAGAWRAMVGSKIARTAVLRRSSAGEEEADRRPPRPRQTSRAGDTTQKDAGGCASRCRLTRLSGKGRTG